MRSEWEMPGVTAVGRRSGSIGLGVIVIAIGVYLAAQALGLPVQPIGRVVGIYWPLAFTLWGAVELIERRGGLFIPIGAIVFGLLFTATNSGLFPLSSGSVWELVGAAVVVALGFEMTMGKRILRHRRWDRRGGTTMHWMWDDREPPEVEKPPQDV